MLTTVCVLSVISGVYCAATSGGTKVNIVIYVPPSFPYKNSTIYTAPGKIVKVQDSKGMNWFGGYSWAHISTFSMTMIKHLNDVFPLWEFLQDFTLFKLEQRRVFESLNNFYECQTYRITANTVFALLSEQTKCRFHYQFDCKLSTCIHSNVRSFFSFKVSSNPILHNTNGTSECLMSKCEHTCDENTGRCICRHGYVMENGICRGKVICGFCP